MGQDWLLFDKNMIWYIFLVHFMFLSNVVVQIFILLVLPVCSMLLKSSLITIIKVLHYFYSVVMLLCSTYTKINVRIL